MDFLQFRQGTGGDQQTYNNLCVLPPNMLNQKFFSIWFVWLTALIIISAIMLVLRIAIVFSSEIRELMLNMVYGIKITNVSYRTPLLKVTLLYFYNPPIHSPYLYIIFPFFYRKRKRFRERVPTEIFLC